MRAEDDDAFIEIYRTQRDRLFRLAVLICGDLDRSEEAVAECFARVLPRWRSGRIDDTALYLRRAVVNEVLGGFRRRVLERRVADRRSGDERGARSLEEHVTGHDQMWTALQALPDHQRAVLVLRFYDDLSEIRTAEVLGVSVGTVKSRVSRALIRLRELIPEEDVDA